MNAVPLGHTEHITCLSCAGAFSIYTCMGLKMRFPHSPEFLVNSGIGAGAVLTMTNVSLYIWQSVSSV